MTLEEDTPRTDAPHGLLAASGATAAQHYLGEYGRPLMRGNARQVEAVVKPL
jgi:hypothetical protein